MTGHPVSAGVAVLTGAYGFWTILSNSQVLGAEILESVNSLSKLKSFLRIDLQGNTPFQAKISWLGWRYVEANIDGRTV